MTRYIIDAGMVALVYISAMVIPSVLPPGITSAQTDKPIKLVKYQTRWIDTAKDKPIAPLKIEIDNDSLRRDNELKERKRKEELEAKSVAVRQMGQTIKSLTFESTGKDEIINKQRDTIEALMEELAYVKGIPIKVDTVIRVDTLRAIYKKGKIVGYERVKY